MEKKKPRRKAPKRSNGTNGANGAHEAELVVPKDIMEGATDVAGSALGAGHAGARMAANKLDPARAVAVLRICLPEDWQNDRDAQRVLSSLDGNQARVIVSWLAAQWAAGYECGSTDARAGRVLTDENA